jgi:hypothetical protein
VGVLTVVAFLAVTAGAFFAFQAVNGSGVVAEVPVRLTDDAPARSDVVLPCVEGWTLDGDSCNPAASPAQWRGGAALPVRQAGGYLAGGLLPATGDLSAPVTLLATTPAWAGLVTGGLVGLGLVPVLRTTGTGHPFAPGNARRLATAAGVVILGWMLATAGPMLAAPTVIHALEAPSGGGVPVGWLAPDLRITWWPLLIVGLLGGLAAATRHGGRLAADAEGLV